MKFGRIFFLVFTYFLPSFGMSSNYDHLKEKSLKYFIDAVKEPFKSILKLQDYLHGDKKDSKEFKQTLGIMFGGQYKSAYAHGQYSLGCSTQVYELLETWPFHEPPTFEILCELSGLDEKKYFYGNALISRSWVTAFLKDTQEKMAAKESTFYHINRTLKEFPDLFEFDTPSIKIIVALRQYKLLSPYNQMFVKEFIEAYFKLTGKKVTFDGIMAIQNGAIFHDYYHHFQDSEEFVQEYNQENLSFKDLNLIMTTPNVSFKEVTAFLKKSRDKGQEPTIPQILEKITRKKRAKDRSDQRKETAKKPFEKIGKAIKTVGEVVEFAVSPI